MKSDLMLIINQLCHERQLPVEVVLEAIEVALIAAYKRNYGGHHSITAQIDSKTGQPKIFVEKAVVEDEVDDPRNEITLAEARKINPKAEAGGLIAIESTPENFGRIAAQTAKQVILQRIREAERDALYKAYADREGEIVNGTVHKIEPHQVTLSLGKVEAVLPRSEQIPTERYSEGQRLRAYIASVNKTSRGPQIVVSRTHRNMLRRLLEVEVPEIYNGTVEIKSIAREAGYRSKVAVAALQEGVDPVGSCVGMRGTRIQSIVNELNGEKIDVVQWNPDTAYFIANALSPAKVMSVMLQDENGKTATVVVPDRQLSLAIGKEGQNARLAAKLTGWRIDIKSASEALQEALTKVRENEEIRTRVSDRLEIFNLAATIASDKDPLEFTEAEIRVIGEAIDLVNLAEMAIERERRAAERAERAARAKDILAEAEAILAAKGPIDEEEAPAEAPVAEEEVAPEAEPEAEAEAAPAEAGAPAEEEAVVAEPEPAPEPAEPEPVELEAEIESMEIPDEEWLDDELEEIEEKSRKKKEARKKKRRLVFDERLGEVVAERRRKRGRRIEDWLDFEDEL
ncbi:MAG: transcription termination/antitermination protein NusA [Chloroflexi bacterium]|nr:MAG: transcription termination/antitermination protein NusA [Chloroflexota bacterium]